MPQPQKLHIVVFDKADGAQVIQLLPGKPEGAQIIYLVVDFFQHFRGKMHIGVAAFKVVFSVEVGMLVKNHLIHIEFIQVGVQQRKHNWF